MGDGPRHEHVWFEEQQTGHAYCFCGRHRDGTDCEDRPDALWMMLADPNWPTFVRKMLAVSMRIGDADVWTA